MRVSPSDGAVAGLGRRLEAEPGQLGLECADAGTAARPLAGLESPGVTGVGRILGIGADSLGQRCEQAGKQRVRRRIEAETWRSGGKEVEVLGASDGSAMHSLDIDEIDVAQALEMQPYGVGVDAEAVGKVLCRQRRSRCRKLSIDRESSVVGECLEHRRIHHPSHRNDGTRQAAYFQDRYCFN